MTAFVVLAAGRGSRLGRIGDDLPKCLLPIDGQAVLSRQLELAPIDARIIIVTGYRSAQVREYLNLAHASGRDVTVITEENWGRGPGASLLEARDVVGDDDMIFVACDTLWEPYYDLWDDTNSWVATAPIPAGTPAARWCRVVTDGDFVTRIDDKTPDVAPGSRCWTALAKVARDDLPTFWAGLVEADTVAGEIQLSAGLQAVLDAGQPIVVYDVNWLDVGDEQAFRNAVATLGGYDPLKPDQVTYVLPRRGRVVKFHVNRDKIRWRAERAKRLGDVVPKVDESFNGTMIGYDYVVGTSLYEANPTLEVDLLLNWWRDKFWSTREQFDAPPPGHYTTSMKFYRDKTFQRVMSLDPALRSTALDAITRVNWDALIDGVVPGDFHGDFTYANVLLTDPLLTGDRRFITIDWREDYAGVTEWGDLRYDLAKLLSGTRFHWRRATYGDFRRWDDGPANEILIENWITANLPEINLNDVRLLAALCLINSAALHAAPMDEILVARGTYWLESLT